MNLLKALGLLFSTFAQAFNRVFIVSGLTVETLKYSTVFHLKSLLLRKSLCLSPFGGWSSASNHFWTSSLHPTHLLIRPHSLIFTFTDDAFSSFKSGNCKTAFKFSRRMVPKIFSWKWTFNTFAKTTDPDPAGLCDY